MRYSIPIATVSYRFNRHSPEEAKTLATELIYIHVVEGTLRWKLNPSTVNIVENGIGSCVAERGLVKCRHLDAGFRLAAARTSA